MPALPARNIRNVETSEPELRPRDAAIRKATLERNHNFEKYTAQNIRNVTSAANDNWANDNNPYPTVSESFAQQQNERTIQPTQNYQPTNRTKVEYQKGVSRSVRQSNSVRSTSVTRSGKNPIRKPSLKRTLPNVPVLDVNPVSLAKGTSASIMNISWGGGLWLGIQLPLAVVSIVLFGLTYFVNDVAPDMIKSVTGETIYKIGETIFSTFSSGVGWLLEKIFGYNLLELLKPETYFMVTHFLVFMIGFATLIGVGIVYQVSLVNCIFGKRSTLKVGTLLFATFAYMVPVLNILPWFVLWVIVVWRYPE